MDKQELKAAIESKIASYEAMMKSHEAWAHRYAGGKVALEELLAELSQTDEPERPDDGDERD